MNIDDTVPTTTQFVISDGTADDAASAHTSAHVDENTLADVDSTENHVVYPEDTREAHMGGVREHSIYSITVGRQGDTRGNAVIADVIGIG